MIRSLEYDLNFFYSNPRIQLKYRNISNSVHLSDVDYLFNRIDEFSKKNKKFYIVSVHETIENNTLLNLLKNKIKELNKVGHEIYISMTSTTGDDLYLHPLLSLLHYNDFIKVRNGFKYNKSFNANDRIYLGDLSLYEYNTNKTNKSILSLRRKTPIRDFLYKKIDFKFDGIFRYLNDDIELYKISPTFTSLIHEYKSSYVSYIVESETTIDGINSFTEKSLFSFASHTLPVLFIQNKNQLREFESLGFYFLNREMGYSDFDYEMTDEQIVDSFLLCIKKINKLSMNDIKNIYEKNIENITNNYKLIEKILKYNEEPFKYESYNFKYFI